MTTEIEQLEAAIAAANKKFETKWATNAINRARFAIGNVFRTKADTKREIEHRKILTELRRLARESWGDEKANWSSGYQDKWYLYFLHTDAAWHIGRYTAAQDQGCVYFATLEAAEAAIETIGAERLMLLLED
jgi:hypothetical protein